jgi:hypothetical protein
MTWTETAPEGHVTEYAVTLGIFDDHDVAPTVVFGVVLPYDGCDLNALVQELCTELLKAARKEYGTKIHRHAAFWQGSQRTVPREQSLAVTQGAPPEEA